MLQVLFEMKGLSIPSFHGRLPLKLQPAMSYVHTMEILERSSTLFLSNAKE